MTQRRFPHTHNNKNNLQQPLDWLQQYPISIQVQPLLLSPIAIETLNYLKPILKEFYPGSTIQPTTEYKLGFKSSFNHLLITIAKNQPKFLTNYILNNNSHISNFNSTSIPFDILLSTLKELLSQLTTTIFCKLNYKALFNSRLFLPPYSIKKRFQIAINLARLHLFLYNTYQTIDYQKFFKDLNLKPIRLRILFHIKYDNPTNQLEFQIYNNSKFNINILLNISTQTFLNTLYIPSFSLYTTQFNTWFNKFFKHYKKQFDNINEQKVYNYIKFQITSKIREEYYKLVPQQFQFPTVSSTTNRTKYSIKAALHHLYTCTNQTKCKLSLQSISHNLHNLTTHFFKQSFQIFPISNYIYPTLNFSTFSSTSSYPASFNILFPFKQLYNLANEAETKFNNLNNTQTNPKRISFFFYTYFKSYIKLAANNDGITDLNLNEALQKYTPTPINPQILSRIIAYYDIIYLTKPTITQLKYNLNHSYITQAEQFIIKKFKINKPNIPNNLFISNITTTTIPHNTLPQITNTQQQLSNTQSQSSTLNNNTTTNTKLQNTATKPKKMEKTKSKKIEWKPIIIDERLFLDPNYQHNNNNEN